MRTSRLLLATVKEDPAEAEIVSHKLMLRAGMVRRLAAFVFIGGIVLLVATLLIGPEIKGSQRWLKLAEMYSLEPIEIKVEWGSAVRVEQIEQAIADNPNLRGKPLIVGHPGRRGVVTTACYLARQSGARDHRVCPLVRNPRHGAAHRVDRCGL